MDFLVQLLEVIKDFWESIWPFYVIDEYERGLILRWGKYHKVVGPGLKIKRPISDKLYTVPIATETISTKPQSLTTKDGKTITTALVIKYKVDDTEESIKKYLLDVRDVTDAIDDIAMAKTKELIMSRTWEECKLNTLDNEISKDTRREAKKWGIYIDYVVIVQLAEFRNIRLVQ
ncbi:MAG: SPFH domain-containing protein [Pseudanabaena sp.]